MELLLQGEQSVSELVAKVDIQQSGVSRHLRILADSGWVKVRPDAQRRLYSLRPERFQELDRWLARYRKLWEARLDRFEQALERKQSLRASSPRKSSRHPKKETRR